MQRCLEKITIQLVTKVRYHTVTSLATVLDAFTRPGRGRATILHVSAARKPVIVRKLSRDWCAGYAAANPGSAEADLELLDTSGKLIRIAWETVKWVCYVRELSAGESSGPDIRRRPPEMMRSSPRSATAHAVRFTTCTQNDRQEAAGLAALLILTDGDELEGVAANDRSLLDETGLLLTPPDTRSNTQRVFVPRSSIREMTVLGVMGGGGKTPTLSRQKPRSWRAIYRVSSKKTPLSRNRNRTKKGLAPYACSPTLFTKASVTIAP